MADKQRQDAYIEKPLPQNVEAERAVLGTMFVEEKAVPQVFAILRGDEFFYDLHKKVFHAMQFLHAVADPLDLITVTDHLRRSENFSAKDVAYVASLADGMMRVSNVESYAKIIKEKFALRRLIHTVHNIKERAFEAKSVNDVLEEATESILAISSESDGPLIRKWYDVAQSALAQIELERKNPDKAFCVSSGIADLDDLTSGGLRRKEFVVIVAPPGNGKTLIAQQYAMNSAANGYRGIIFSAEMSGEDLARRELAWEAGVEFRMVRRPHKLSDEEYIRLKSAGEYFKPITVVERDISTGNIFGIIEAHKRSELGLDFVIVDYDQLVVEAGINPDEDEKKFFFHQRAFNLQVKKLAERLDICFILLSQLRKMSHRVSEGKRPILDDIYGDSSIRNAPQVILWIERKFSKTNKPADERVVKVYVMKARNDRTGTIDLDFDPFRLRLGNALPSQKDSTEEK